MYSIAQLNKMEVLKLCKVTKSSHLTFRQLTRIILHANIYWKLLDCYR